MAPILNNRAIVEQDLALTFSEKGVKSTPTYVIFPFAATPELVESAYEDPEELQAFVRRRINDNNIDALLIITVFDEKKESRYVGGSSVSIGVAAPGYQGMGASQYLDPNVPTYKYSYMGYYGYSYATVYGTEGYYKTTSTYFIECNLYDVASESLIWTGQTITKVPESVNRQSKQFATTVVDAIIKIGAIKI